MTHDATGVRDNREVEIQRLSEASLRERRKRRGLVVGIGAYVDLSTLDNAPRDGMAVAHHLEKDYGFPIQLLLDGEATRDAIDRAIREELDRADGSTQWVFFFAGHGMERDGRGYLVPVSGRRDDLQTCLPLSDLLTRCLESNCGEILIVLDTCHAGQALIRDEELSELLDPAREKNWRVRQILCSGNPYETVRDDGGQDHSAFTECLLESLEGGRGSTTPRGPSISAPCSASCNPRSSGV